MANNDKQRKTTFSAESFRHIRTNLSTGEQDCFFPLEITDPSIRELARERGLEISRSRLGNRVFDAVMIPCKTTAMIHGREVYIDTPFEVQRQRYLALIKDELNTQEAAKQDGRCQIPDGHGGLKRCPCRVPNPDYVPGGAEPKTLPVLCEGCVYEELRQAHTTIGLPDLDHQDERGEAEPYEPASPETYYEGDRYERASNSFLEFVRERDPKLAALAELLTQEYTKSEAAMLLGDARSTVGSRAEKLKALCSEFLDAALII